MNDFSETMKTILAVCTILGGLSAIWFFWDKLSFYFKTFFHKLISKTAQPNPLSIPDKEFEFLSKIPKQSLESGYLPTSKEEIALCNSLVNHGVLKLKNNSYVVNKSWRNVLQNA